MHPIAVLSVFFMTDSPAMVESPHTPPQELDAPASITVPPVAAAVEYPLAAQFVAAHPGNFVENGMDTPQHVIIHQMEGSYQSTLYWFQDPGSNVSTHYIMRSVDGEITQMVEHADMGQHIGGYNPISFGIEHEGFIYEPGWFTWEAYLSSAQLTRWLCDNFDIPADRDHILGHVEVPGASHTDPGPYWNWDMYMAMVHDVVPEGRVEGVVVDRTQPCTITTTADTWITTTLEGLDALDDDEQCFLPAGTDLTYLHASDEMISQARLTMQGGGPCAGIGGLDTQAFIYLPSFTPLCEVTPLADYEGVTVTVGGVETTIDAEGRFRLDGVSAGAHTVDVASDGAWQSTCVPIDMAVYPGVRVVVALEPGDDVPEEPTTDDGSGDGGDGDGASDGASASAGSEGGQEPDLDAHDDDADPEPTDDGEHQELDEPGMTEPSGCACSTSSTGPGAGLAMFMLAAGSLRRRRLSKPRQRSQS